MKSALLSAAVAALVLSTSAHAAPHANYKGIPADDIPTYRNSRQVSAFVFSLIFPDGRARVVPDAVDSITFRKGQPPAEWWGRSYFPATLQEIMGSIGGTSRYHMLTDWIFLDGKAFAFAHHPIVAGQVDPQWNSCTWEGSDMNDRLAPLAVGRHQLILWRQVSYEVRTVATGTAKPTWEPAHLTLSKGTLGFDVRD